MITKEDLSDFERGMKAVSGVISLFTLGQGSIVMNGGRIALGETVKMGSKVFGNSGVMPDDVVYQRYLDDGVRPIEGGSKTINPQEIRFSQSSVNGSSEIIDSMKKNGWKGDPIDVVEMPDGIYTTIDNTRVVSAREAGISVQANVHGYNDTLPQEYIERFTTKKASSYMGRCNQIKNWKTKDIF